MPEPKEQIGASDAAGSVPVRWGVCWAVALVVAGGLYVATANRGAQWQDSGFQQLRIVTGQLDHPRGLALVHPVHYYLGRAFLHLPIDEPAFAITLVSAGCGALAVANIAATLVLLTRRILPAVIGAGALLLSHTFWQHATHTESYALVAALLSGEWLCLAAFLVTGRTGWLIGLAACNGLGVANHLLAALVTPVDLFVVAWFWRNRQCSGRCVVIASVAWLVATLPYSLLVAGQLVSTGDWLGTIRSALFGRYADSVLNTSLNSRVLLMSLGLLIYNFPNLSVPFFLAFARRRRGIPRAFVHIIVCELVIYVAFVARYSIVDQYSYYFPVYMLIALIAGMAYWGMAERVSRRTSRGITLVALVLILVMPVTYLVAVQQCASRRVFASIVGNKPYRDGYAAFLLPWGCATRHGDQLNEAVAGVADEGSLIFVADSMMSFGIRYGQETGRVSATATVRSVEAAKGKNRPEELAKAARETHLAGRPVVLIPRDRDKPGEAFAWAEWRRVGDVYVLVGLDAATAGFQAGAE